MVKIKYVTKRPGSAHFQYIRNVKPGHRHLFGGRRQVWRSLKTDDESVAIVRASRVTQWYEQIIRKEGTEEFRLAGDAETPSASASYYNGLLPSAIDDQEWAEYLSEYLTREELTAMVVERRKEYSSREEFRRALDDDLDSFEDRQHHAQELLKAGAEGISEQMLRAEILGMKALIERTHKMRAVLDGEPLQQLNAGLYEPIKVMNGVQRQIGRVATDYLQNYTETENGRTLSQKQARLDVLLSWVGKDRDIAEISGDHIVDLMKNVLPYLPKRPKHVCTELPTKALVELVKEKNILAIGLKTQGLYLSEWKTFFGSIPARKLIDRNPCEGLKVKGANSEERKREGFTTKELRTLFSAPVYTGRLGSGPGEWQRPGNEIIRDSKFWIPLISLFSGMTVAEICNLEKRDFKKVAEVDVMYVHPDGGRGTTVKTKSRIREVPVHPELKAIGLLDYVRALPKGPAFPDLFATAKRPSDAFGKWFLLFRRSLGVERDEKPEVSFHSFRHSFREACRECEIPDYIAKRLGGWSAGNEQQAKYGSLNIVELNRQLKKLDYAGVDFSHLRL